MSTGRQRRDAGVHELLAGIRSGDEASFMMLVERYGAEMSSAAIFFEPRRRAAERLVEQAWALALTELGSAETAPSFRLWILRVLRRAAEDQGVSVSSERFGRPSPVDNVEQGAAASPADRFHHGGEWAGHWRSPPRPWGALVASEAASVIATAMETLPGLQRIVLELRDVHGWHPDDVCAYLDIDPVTQRALLHRARSSVHSMLDEHVRSGQRGVRNARRRMRNVPTRRRTNRTKGARPAT